MEKDQNQDIKEKDTIENPSEVVDEKSNKNLENTENLAEKSPEEKILELEDKLTRTFAEMENQRRRGSF